MNNDVYKQTMKSQYELEGLESARAAATLSVVSWYATRGLLTKKQRKTLNEIVSFIETLGEEMKLTIIYRQ